MTDLWPNDLRITQIKAPITILKEQAALLGNKTQNIVMAQVTSMTWRRQYSQYNDFNYAFYLLGPALDNYRYELFIISHGVELYPVEFELDSDMTKDILNDSSEKVSAANEAEFQVILAKIFQSEKTRHIINAILAQSGALGK